jgi:hypothetical protein
MSANSYPQINEVQEIPSVLTIGLSNNLISASGTVIPLSWNLTNYPTTDFTDYNIQRIVNSLFCEFQYLLPSINSVYSAKSWGFDVSEPDFAWYVNFNEKLDTIGVRLSDDTTTTPKQVDSYLNLFFSDTWTYKKINDDILICNLSLQEQDTIKNSDDWHYISDFSKFNNSTLSFWLHPNSKSWIPLPPSKVREDGFLGFRSSKDLKVRSVNRTAAKQLKKVDVVLNGSNYQATRVPIWSSADEKGLYFLLKRKNNDDNLDLGNKILFSSWFSKTQNTKDVKASLGICLDSYEYQALSATSSGTYDATYSNFSVRDVPEYSTILETNLTFVGTGVVSRYTNVDNGIAIINGLSCQVTNTSGSLSFNNVIPKASDDIIVEWRLNNWTSNGSGVVFNNHIKTIQKPIEVLKTRNINIINNNLTDHITNIRKEKAPKWTFSDNYIKYSKGLSIFE